MAPSVKRDVVGIGAPGEILSTVSEDHRIARMGWVVLVVAALLLGATLRLWMVPHPPPALMIDETENGEDVLDILSGHLAIFFPRNNGREPLFIYSQALSVFVLGPTAFALRFPMACFGILALAATYALGRDWYGRWVGLLAMTAMGTSFWHLALTRVGLRAGAVPLFVVLCMYATGRALRTGSRRQACLSGFWLACGLYTYLSMRLMAVVLLVGYAVLLLRPSRNGMTRRWRSFRIGMLAALTSVVLVAPLGAYLLAHPDQFAGRIAQVSVFNQHPTIIGKHMGLGESLLRTFGGFFIHGDDNFRQNVPGRPIFDPLNAALWLSGLGVLCWRLVRRIHASATQPFMPDLWLVLWMLIIESGSALAQESPYFARLSAAIPSVFVMWALGAVVFRQWLSRWEKHGAKVASVVVAFLLLFQTGATARDLFVRWGQSPQTWLGFDGDIYDCIGALLASPYATMDPTRMIFQLDAMPPVQFRMPQTRQSVWVRQYSSALVLPAAGAGDVLFLYPHLRIQPTFPHLFPDAIPVLRGERPGGGTAFVVYRLTADTLASVRRPSAPITAHFSDRLTLLGAVHPLPTAPIAAGAATSLQLLWRVSATDRQNYGLYVHLVDSEGRTWVSADEQADLTNGWQKDQEILSGHAITVPADAPPGRYTLVVGAGLRTLDEQPSRYTQSLGADVPLGAVTISPPLPGSSATPTVAAKLDQTIAGVRLVGRGTIPEQVRQGDVLEVPLVWQQVAAPAPLMEALALVGTDGTPLAQGTPMPAGGAAYPPPRWSEGRSVRDFPRLHIGPTMKGGTYEIVLGLFAEGSQTPSATVRLGSVEVTERPRTYAIPSPQHQTNAVFGDSIRLLGYDLDSGAGSTGPAVTLTLYWQAITTPAVDLTVFVHLLGTDNRIVAQRDSQPLEGGAPTSGWLPGEVLKDTYVIPRPTGAADQPLVPEIGLYDAATGKRLVLTAGGTGDHMLLDAVGVPR